MPKIESYKQGTPSWIDYGARDKDAAKEFYADIFGWTYKDVDFYSIAMLDGAYAGNIYPQHSQEILPHWNVYLTVENVDETTAKVNELGGKVFFGPSDVPEPGRMSEFSDPTGAMIQIWQPINHIGLGIKGEHGALVWAELLTTDQSKATDFYSKLLGIDMDDSMPSPDGGKYVVFMASEEDGVAGCMTMPEDLRQQNIPSHWSPYFQVDDVDATVSLAASKGADLAMPGMEIPGVGRIAFLMDPQGAGFGLITPEPM